MITNKQINICKNDLEIQIKNINVKHQVFVRSLKLYQSLPKQLCSLSSK